VKAGRKSQIIDGAAEEISCECFAAVSRNSNKIDPQ